MSSYEVSCGVPGSWVGLKCFSLELMRFLSQIELHWLVSLRSEDEEERRSLNEPNLCPASPPSSEEDDDDDDDDDDDEGTDFDSGKVWVEGFLLRVKGACF